MHRTRIPAWAKARGQKVNHFPVLEPARTALLVVDLQNAYLESTRPDVIAFARPIVSRINRLAERLRAAGGAVVFLRQSFGDDPAVDLAPWQKQAAPRLQAFRDKLRPGLHSHELFGGLDVRPDDLIVDKYRHSAFVPHSSDLHGRLQARGVDTVVVTGALTNACCESTARDAVAWGYRVYFVSDATAAMTNAEHNAALLNLRCGFADVRTTREMERLIGESHSAYANT